MSSQVTSHSRNIPVSPGLAQESCVLEVFVAWLLVALLPVFPTPPAAKAHLAAGCSGFEVPHISALFAIERPQGCFR